MADTDPKREFAVEIVLKLQEAGYTALWAGGCVRDILMGRPPQDYDVATNAMPDDVRQLFGPRRTLGVGASFGVILVRGPRAAGQVEVATFRTEGPYLDGRHPEHVAFSTPEEDAQRRDFTVNGMFLDPVDDRVFDFVGGQEDLARRLVRAIGDPKARMQEDKLRMLRAVRFAAGLEFELDRETARTVQELRREIHVVSAERIAQELRKMLKDRHRRRAIELMREVGLLNEVFPEVGRIVPLAEPVPPTIGQEGDSGAAGIVPLAEPVPLTADDWTVTLQMLDGLREPSFALAMAAFLCHVAEETDVAALASRLRLANQERDNIQWLLTHRQALAAASSLPMARLKPILANPLSSELIELSRVAVEAMHGDLSEIEFCTRFLQNTPHDELDPHPLITGSDLIAQGLKPGPEFKSLLRAAREAQLNAEIHTRDEALRLVNRLRSSPKNDMKR